MASTTDDLVLYLTTTSASIPTPHGTAGVDFLSGLLPATPDAALAILGLPTSPPAETFTLLPVFTMETVRLLVRNPVYATAETKAWAAWAALAKVLNQTINGTRYLSITATQTPYLFERDANRRNIFSCDFLVRREISA